MIGHRAVLASASSGTGPVVGSCLSLVAPAPGSKALQWWLRGRCETPAVLHMLVHGISSGRIEHILRLLSAMHESNMFCMRRRTH